MLSEGVNLHRANVVINYDIPWNPTRLMQRVGRINRVDTTFDTIYTFNFFPTRQANDEIKLKEAAAAKINAFLTLLGGDAALLTEGEPVGSHELFNRLVSRQTLVGEEAEESELKYLMLIKEIRDKDPDLFAKIKRLPPKARSAKKSDDYPDSLLTYFRRGKVQKFFLTAVPGDSVELDFMAAAALLESTAVDPRQKLPPAFFDLLDQNKEAFIIATTEDLVEPAAPRRGQDNARQLRRILQQLFKQTAQLTDEQEQYAQTVIARLEEGGLPRQTIKTTMSAVQALGAEAINPLKTVALLQTHIPPRLLASHYAEQNPLSAGKREVILSMYLSS